jgi:hypothetical protein
MARILAKRRDEPDLSEHEKILWARSLAATPDERWRMNLERVDARKKLEAAAMRLKKRR